jgi:molecular chaperone GrpE (heat shock protein)
VTALVDLSDRMSSAALRAEIVATLARVGVHAVEPAQGEVFDANRMRGVGSAPAPDPSWVGRVAATERAGFQDGTTVLRLPEVVVYTAGG